MQRDVGALRLMVPVLVAGGVVLSGCQSPAGTPGTPTITSGGPIPSAVGTPGGAPSGSSDAASGAAASITGPTTAAEVRANVPEAAKKHTPDGAGEFARYYVSMMNEVAYHRRKGVMAGLGDPRCVACRVVDDDIDDLLKKGQRYQEPPLRVVNVYPTYTETPPRQLVNVIVDDTKNRVIGKGDVTAQVINGGRSDYLFDLRWRQGQWVVSEFQADPVEVKR